MNIRKTLLSVVQLGLGLGLLAYLLVKINKEGGIKSAVVLAVANWPWVVAGLLFCLLCHVLCAWRWQALLHAQGLPVSSGRVMRLYFIGHFFNSVMPGATGGDVVKAVLAARDAHGRRTEAVSTVLIDRIIGLLGLVALVVVVTIVNWRFYLSHPVLRLAVLFNGVLFAGSIAGVALVFGQNIFERIPLFRRFEQGTAVGQTLARVYQAFRVCLRQPGVLLRTLGLSIMNHLALIVAWALFGRALGLTMTFGQYLATCPIVNAIGTLPLTPGGLGTRDAASKVVLGVLGVPPDRAVALSLLVYATMMLFLGLLSGLVYLDYLLRGGPRAAAIVADSREA